ncbi:TetR/AcrR family transcriptional regulator [Mucilaginibacter sp. E4BP6]|uniref:TetR/AcrR family transcriptional regulator n=1 Tax=Mucilaginibacter sp. E4BP6 TaxID=2723089 RepID=UPI0015C7D341|nr:TetR/AcrR family transcriptional regulator [Mucilaginibacter sp. E4BP6]NYE67022.1 AcrR family transcriptional regulator [Mucilaginibacter sp. E4BP6]
MKNKEETKQRIINAVGEIFKVEGREGLNYARIAKRTGVDRGLIYRYFGKDINNLIEAYVVQKDYWLKFAEHINAEVKKNYHDSSKDLVIDILMNHWRYFSVETEMQQLILWELSGKSDLMRSIHNTRELMAQPIIELAEADLKNKNVKFKPIAVLLEIMMNETTPFRRKLTHCFGAN